MSVAALLKCIDEYAELRERLRRTPDSDQPATRTAIDLCLESWHRLLEARSEISNEGRSND